MPYTIQYPDSTGSVSPRQRWSPTLASGHFFIGDRRYYLYGNKQTSQLADLEWYVFELSALPDMASSITVTFEGTAVPQSSYMVKGDEIWIKPRPATGDFANDWTTPIAHATQEVTDNQTVLPNEATTSISVSYTSLTWVATGGGTPGYFTTTAENDTFALEDGEKSYYLPTDILLGAPVVITDDSIEYSDQRDFVVEFSIDRELETGVGYKINFNSADNLFKNPVFRYYVVGQSERNAYSWSEIGATGLVFRKTTEGYVGHNSLYVGPTGLVVQEVTCDGRQTYTISYAATTQDGTGSVRVELAFLDPSGSIIDSTGGVLGSHPDYGLNSYNRTDTILEAWDKYTLTVGEQRIPYDAPESALPEDMSSMEVRFRNVGSVPVDIGITQFQVGPTGTDFAYVDPLSTVEQEIDPTGIFSYSTGRFGNYDIWGLDLNQANEDTPHGFIAINEDIDAEDWHLGLGDTALYKYYTALDFDTTGYVTGGTSPNWPGTYGVGQIVGTGAVNPSIDYLVIDGLNRDSSLQDVTADDLRWKLFRGRQMQAELIDTKGVYVPLLGVDFEDDTPFDVSERVPDWHGRSRGRHLSRLLSLDGHYVSSTGSIDVIDPSGDLVQWPFPHTPLGIIQPGATGLIGPTGFPLDVLGRKHVPYSLTTGYGKLRQRSILRLENVQ